MLLFCFCVFETEPFWSLCGGLFFLFFVAPSLAVFKYAYAFNQDVSNWNTGAVISMSQSKCTLFIYGHAFRCCFVWMYDNSSFIADHNSHTFCYLFIFGCVWLWVIMLSFSVVLLFCEVFYKAGEFNSDISKWDMSNVIDMFNSTLQNICISQESDWNHYV